MVKTNNKTKEKGLEESKMGNGKAQVGGYRVMSSGNMMAA